MNKAERKLLCGKAIKALMLARGAQLVYQNIYKTGTRSVKCYTTNVGDLNTLRDQITDLADMFDLDVKFNITKAPHWSFSGFIAKL